jgi:hypothetical protein
VSKTTVLATGRITGAEIITITHVKWSDSSPVVMIRWPGQPSLTDPNRLPEVANELMALMAEANAKLGAIQRQQPHSGRKDQVARSPQGPFLSLNHSGPATMLFKSVTSKGQETKSGRARKSPPSTNVSPSTGATRK